MSAPHAENMAYVRRKGNTKGNFHQFKRWEPPLSIDSKGVVIFTLDSGGTIRDTGKEVFFSADKSQDNVETVLVNKLLDYLSLACKPVRVLELLCYRFSADYRNDNNNVSKGNEEASYELPE